MSPPTLTSGRASSFVASTKLVDLLGSRAPLARATLVHLEKSRPPPDVDLLPSLSGGARLALSSGRSPGAASRRAQAVSRKSKFPGSELRTYGSKVAEGTVTIHNRYRSSEVSPNKVVQTHKGRGTTRLHRTTRRVSRNSRTLFFPSLVLAYFLPCWNPLESLISLFSLGESLFELFL